MAFGLVESARDVTTHRIFCCDLLARTAAKSGNNRRARGATRTRRHARRKATMAHPTKYDDTLFSMMQQHENEMEFLNTIFGFLQRRSACFNGPKVAPPLPHTPPARAVPDPLRRCYPCARAHTVFSDIVHRRASTRASRCAARCA